MQSGVLDMCCTCGCALAVAMAEAEERTRLASVNTATPALGNRNARTVRGWEALKHALTSLVVRSPHSSGGDAASAA